MQLAKNATDAATEVHSEHDVIDEVVRSMLASPEDAYWARRLLDLVRDPLIAERYQHEIVLAVECWAKRDSAFFVHERYLSEQLAVWSWPREIIDALERRLDLPDPAMTHFVLGRLWLEARRPPEDMPEFYARAVRHLSEVPPHLQIGTWHESMCEALGVADPTELDRRASDILATVSESSRDRAILAILRGAARAANWELYDMHRRAFGYAAESAEIARLDGLRAEDQLMRPFRRISSLAMTIPSPSSISEVKTVRPPSRI